MQRPRTGRLYPSLRLPLQCQPRPFFSAGALFIPSPIMHTGKPAFSYSSIYSSLFSGRQPLETSSPARFVNRKALSCHYSIVYQGGAMNDNSVNRNCLSREDTDNIADLYLFGRDNAFLITGENSCCTRSEIYKLFYAGSVKGKKRCRFFHI